jgi:NAD(P)-dependent dehydrogenase (short-subunit alcohol dehydrogenase family)
MSKVWFVTGAGSGIGAGIAKAALRAGDRVVVTGRDLGKVRTAYNDVATENIAVVKLDVTNEAQVGQAVATAVRQFGRIDVLVSNAGYILGFEGATAAELGSNSPLLWGGERHGPSFMMRERDPARSSISSSRRVGLTLLGVRREQFAVEGLSLAVAESRVQIR